MTRSSKSLSLYPAKSPKSGFANGFLGLFDWSRQEDSTIDALTKRVTSGYCLNELLAVIGCLDEKIGLETERLRTRLRVADSALRDLLFGAAYVTRPQLHIGGIVSTLRSGFPLIGPKFDHSGEIEDFFNRSSLSDGQLMSILQLAKGRGNDPRLLASKLPSLFRRFWSAAPYHLRIELLAASGCCFDAPAMDRLAIIEVIEQLPDVNNIFLSTAWVEALSALGALDSDAANHKQYVETAIAQCLKNETDAESQQEAFGIWAAQFDHPYDSAYMEAIGELRAKDHSAFLLMAGRGGLILDRPEPILAKTLAKQESAEACEVLCGWIRPPHREYFIEQEVMSVFTTSCATLGSMNLPLPASPARILEPTAEAFMACGSLLYWLSRNDIADGWRRSECLTLLRVLERQDGCFGASILMEFSDDKFNLFCGGCLVEGTTLLWAVALEFPDVVCDFFRHSLASPDKQQGYLRWLDKSKLHSLALSVLEHFGNATDIPLLRRLSSDGRAGAEAIQALQQLEERLNS